MFCSGKPIISRRGYIVFSFKVQIHIWRYLRMIVLLQNIMKRLEKLERSLHVYQEKMDGNIFKTSEEIANPPVSSLKKPGGTSVMKMTKFMVGTQ